MPQTFNVGARSRFVTITAWAFLLLAGLAAFSTLLADLHPQAASAGSWPALLGLIVDHLPWLMRAGLVVSMLMVASAVGVLLRLDWARRVFIGLLVLTLLANLPGLWVQQEVVQALLGSRLGGVVLPPQAADLVSGLSTAARSMAAVMTLVGCALLVWIIRRLMSPAVRQEFA
jgi:hypothetical protein